jgi:hypothetical protein
LRFTTHSKKIDELHLGHRKLDHMIGGGGIVELVERGGLGWW